MKTVKNSVNKKMLAYCGLYCEQCSFKAAHDEQDTKHLDNLPYQYTKADISEYNCECCKGYCICGPCKIKPCASAKNIDSCADCGDFPCEKILAFAGDGIPHHKTAMENLAAIRENGPEAWFESIRPQLYCECGQKQTWYYRCDKHSGTQ